MKILAGCLHEGHAPLAHIPSLKLGRIADDVIAVISGSIPRLGVLVAKKCKHNQ